MPLFDPWERPLLEPEFAISSTCWVNGWLSDSGKRFLLFKLQFPYGGEEKYILCGYSTRTEGSDERI